MIDLDNQAGKNSFCGSSDLTDDQGYGKETEISFFLSIQENQFKNSLRLHAAIQ
jgi:hypothetical protein